MATTFITDLSEFDYVLTSKLDSIQARTDKSKVEVKVVRDPDGEADIFFSTTLYAFDEVVELSAVGKLIEEHFRAKNRITDMISVDIDGVLLDFKALYCTHNLRSDFDPEKCFWSTSATALVHRNSIISLAHHDYGSDEYRVKVVGHSPDGQLAMVESSFHRRVGSLWVSFSVAAILDFALSQSDIDGNETDGQTETALSDVAYFSIEHCNLQKIYYLVNDPSYLTFCFRNLFNAPEYIDIVGNVKRKTVVDREVAVCSGRSRQYNQVINRSYEVETAPLTSDQASAVEQLISSYSVQLCGKEDDYGIIITDHTCEVSNDDDSLVAVKFTFQLTDSRPALLDSEMNALAPSDSHIFSKEFTAVFA